MIKDSLKSSFLKIIRKCFSDKQYYAIRFFIKYKRFLNLKNPKSFNAKLTYLKLYDRNPLYVKLVDKHEVRSFVEKRIGKEYLIDQIGLYNNENEIVFDHLPELFVLKATHGSSWVIVCEDKSKLDIELAKKEIHHWFNNNFYDLWGEWVYKKVPPRVVCEKFLKDEEEKSLLDYKFYCFDGVPKFIHVDLERFQKHQRNFYDLNWNRLPFGLCYPQGKRDVKKPKQLELMKELVSKLSKGFRFVRVDMYEVKNKVYFGELTFYPGNALEKFTPDKYDFVIGEYLNL